MTAIQDKTVEQDEYALECPSRERWVVGSVQGAEKPNGLARVPPKDIPFVGGDGSRIRYQRGAYVGMRVRVGRLSVNLSGTAGYPPQADLLEAFFYLIKRLGRRKWK